MPSWLWHSASKRSTNNQWVTLWYFKTCVCNFFNIPPEKSPLIVKENSFTSHKMLFLLSRYSNICNFHLSCPMFSDFLKKEKLFDRRSWKCKIYEVIEWFTYIIYFNFLNNLEHICRPENGLQTSSRSLCFFIIMFIKRD